MTAAWRHLTVAALTLALGACCGHADDEDEEEDCPKDDAPTGVVLAPLTDSAHRDAREDGKCRDEEPSGGTLSVPLTRAPGVDARVLASDASVMGK